jgi:hypothetical protein
LTLSTSDWSNVNSDNINTCEFEDADAGWYGNSIGTWSFIFLPFNVIAGESRDSSIPHTLLDWWASAMLIILLAASLHSFEVSEAANASLKLLLVNAGPIRSVDAATTATWSDLL